MVSQPLIILQMKAFICACRPWLRSTLRHPAARISGFSNSYFFSLFISLCVPLITVLQRAEGTSKNFLFCFLGASYRNGYFSSTYEKDSF
jgi:hypothetical protein